MKACCLSGSRPKSLPWGTNEDDYRCKELKQRLTLEIEKAIIRGYRHFISGMALGVEQYAFEILINYKKNNPEVDIFLEAAIPCESQAYKWNEKQRNRYFKILENVDKETLISHRYNSLIMQQRNKYMVNKSSLLIAVTNSFKGGTINTINFAKAYGIEIILISH